MGTSASGRDMLWMAHCRMPSKECCGQSRERAQGLAGASGGRCACLAHNRSSLASRAT